ncbi:adenylate/guanylate cyclase domain-containing protein [Aquibium pacificus]
MPRRPHAFRMPRVRLGHALTALLLLAILSTAFTVQFLWRGTADRNVDGVVAALESSSVDAVRRELESSFAAAEASAEIVRSVLFQRTITADDEAKREFLFLPLLRSHPLFGWIGFGFPDGRFFGAHARSDGNIEMIEIGAAGPDGGRPLRRDVYRPLPGDIFFLERQKGAATYVPAGSPWYRKGSATDQPIWTMADVLAAGFEPSIVAAKRVEVRGEFAGVVMVAIPLDRLSGVLARLNVTGMGEIHVLGGDGTVLASSESERSLAARLADFPAEDALAHAADGVLSHSSDSAIRTVVNAGAAGPVHVSVAALPFDGWRVVTVTPRSRYTAEIDRNSRRITIVVLVLVALAAGSAVLFATVFLTWPVARLAGELQKVERFALSAIEHRPTLLAELNDFSIALRNMAGGLAAFARYMPLDIVRPLVEGGIDPRPGGTLREVTVMFADMPNFTELTERLGPDVEPFLTEFLTIAVEAVHREGGTVDKFIGDAVMAIWNAPNPVHDHAMRACRAAASIRDRMPRRDPGSATPRVRIGINTGTALVGNVGSAERLSYTAIGDTVNLASRLVGTAKELGIEIAASAATALAVDPSVHLRPMGVVAIRGRSGRVDVFEVV